MSWYGGFAPYVPVGQRIAEGKAEVIRRLGKDEKPQPIKISGNGIATTFWGKNWCTHLEKYSDFSNRLPRGRTYARNGSIAHLRITKGKITSMVCGSYLYEIEIKIDPLPAATWAAICRSCSSSIHSIMDLMRGRLGDDVIRRITEPKSGMFPANNEIRLRCSCPDGAYLCKHLAATLYGVGHRLDSSPELLFLLRCVDQNELISQAISAEGAASAMGLDENSGLGDEDLGAMFGIELADTQAAPAPVTPKTAKRKTSKKKTTTKKKAIKKKASKKKTRKPAAKKKATKKKAPKKRSVQAKKKTKTAKPKSTAKQVGTKKRSTKKPTVKRSATGKKKPATKKPAARTAKPAKKKSKKKSTKKAAKRKTGVKKRSRKQSSETPKVVIRLG
ncbi:SWIM zinc finger family protein [Aporhodopirellula aestuarii]|uniref:SWIM zinc finger family protein n=1 Tax=Aporhodopirellula aestuarii TaxID=2950107 RepID=A0ABT0TYV1_9BACT|nr:SWIM zinc finger family protein [Aporhodopirellula aestuarii]MCM2369782.1 SWIM zinc finger family protein [Aporhodopirellula aestuarii]